MGNAYRDDLAAKIGLAECRRILDAGIPEATFQNQVLDLAALKRWRSYHTHDSRRSTPGFPDLVLVRGNRMVAAELKREKGRLTAEQKGWLEALAAVTDVESFLWRPSDFDEIAKTLA